jgi:hypothetical protein
MSINFVLVVSPQERVRHCQIRRSWRSFRIATDNLIAECFAQNIHRRIFGVTGCTVLLKPCNRSRSAVSNTGKDSSRIINRYTSLVMFTRRKN